MTSAALRLCSQEKTLDLENQMEKTQMQAQKANFRQNPSKNLLEMIKPQSFPPKPILNSDYFFQKLKDLGRKLKDLEKNLNKKEC